MTDYRKMAGDGDRVATGYGVFFISERSAEAFKNQHGGELVPSQGGWLVKKEITEASDHDPIIQAIRQALGKAGLGSN